MNAHVASGAGFIAEPLSMNPTILQRPAVVDETRLRALLQTLKTLPDAQPPVDLIDQTLHRIETSSISSPLPRNT